MKLVMEEDPDDFLSFNGNLAKQPLAPLNTNYNKSPKKANQYS